MGASSSSPMYACLARQGQCALVRPGPVAKLAFSATFPGLAPGPARRNSRRRPANTQLPTSAWVALAARRPGRGLVLQRVRIGEAGGNRSGRVRAHGYGAHDGCTRRRHALNDFIQSGLSLLHCVRERTSAGAKPTCQGELLANEDRAGYHRGELPIAKPARFPVQKLRYAVHLIVVTPMRELKYFSAKFL